MITMLKRFVLLKVRPENRREIVWKLSRSTGNC